MSNTEIQNVFIFNFNDNNENLVKLLQATFEKFNCIVKIYEKLGLSDLLEVAKSLKAKNFEFFNYAVIVVLNDSNKSETTLPTSDGETVMLNSEFLNNLLRNRSLCKKKRLFLLQLNRENVLEEKEENEILEKVEKRQNENNEYSYFGTDVYLNTCSFGAKLPKNKDAYLEKFCETFSEYGDKWGIDKIHNEVYEILENMEDVDIPSINDNFSDSSDRVFGYAITDKKLRDFLPVHFKNLKQKK